MASRRRTPNILILGHNLVSLLLTHLDSPSGHTTMILRNSPENRARLFKCSTCEQMMPGASFYCLTEKPALAGKTITHFDNIGKIARPYARAAWRTRAIDPERPCRACRARTATYASQAKAKERDERLREQAIAFAIEKNLPIPVHLLKQKPRGSGPDPVLQSISMALALTRQQQAKALLKERVAGAGSVGNSNARASTYYKWLLRLYDARIAVYETARERRKLDLQSPITANDAQRTHMRVYIKADDRRTLDWIADKVNAHRPPGKGRPFKGLNNLNTPQPLDPEGEARAQELLRKAWEPFRDAVRLTLRASRSAVRDKHRATPNARTLRYGDSDEKFTMEQYHMKRIECAQSAEREIERCLAHNIHPQSWAPDEDTEPRALRTWGPLVLPLLREELRAMWVVLPEVVQNRARPFPMLRREMKGARKYQQAQVLNADGTPLSDRLATEYEVE